MAPDAGIQSLIDPTPMDSPLASQLNRWSRVIIAACILLCVAQFAVLLTGLAGEEVTAWVGAWGNLPLMGVILVMLWPIVTDRGLSPMRRRGFQLLALAQILDFIASIGWGYGALTTNETWGLWPDVVWIFFYPLAGAAFLLFYFDL